MRTPGKPTTPLSPPPSAAAVPQENGHGGEMPGMVQVRTEVITAVRVQVPRNKDVVLAECIKDAGRMGEDFFYSWTVKDKHAPGGRALIKGMSIGGAEMIARNWGNCTIGVTTEVDGLQHWVFKARFIDYEAGYVSERLYRQRKTESHSERMDADRLLDIAFQIGQSKAIRNAIDHGIPAWLVNEAMKAATDVADKRYENVPESLDRFRRHAKKIGITEKQLEDKIGRPLKEWTKFDCVELASVFRAIQENVVTAADEFPPTETAVEEPPQQPESAVAPKDAKPEAKADTKAESAKEPSAGGKSEPEKK